MIEWSYINGVNTAKNFHNCDVGFTKNINTYDSNITSEELIFLFEETMKSTKEEPTIYNVRDRIDFPQLMAIWQNGKSYRTVLLYLANDNRGIIWLSAEGHFEKKEEFKYDVIEDNWKDHKPFQP